MAKVAIIGYGNVGHHLALNISRLHDVTIFGRTAHDDFVKEIDTINPDEFDFIIISVPDRAIQEVANELASSEAIVLHTSGSRPIADLSKHNRYGVMYPLQTFSKDKRIDFKTFPIFIEGKDDLDKDIFSFVRTFCNDARIMSSVNRKRLHLAAVFACNFTNHLYHISEKILEEIELGFADISHLAQETVTKAAEITPVKAQTGPAIRGDKATIQEHLSMIRNPEWERLYQLISEDIRRVRE